MCAYVCFVSCKLRIYVCLGLICEMNIGDICVFRSDV